MNSRELKNFLNTIVRSENKDPIMLHGAPGIGKCLGRGTPILMYDGSIKTVEDVKQGDLIMGPDSQPRLVLNTTNGTDEMYEICPVEGDAYVVNSQHILSLRISDEDNLVNISVSDYLDKSSYFKERAKGWRTAVNFASKPVTLEPYFLGLWLGDGSSGSATITTGSEVVSNYLASYATTLGLENKVTQKELCLATSNHLSAGKTDPKFGRNPVLNALRELNVIKNKHIPDVYKINDAAVRGELLAGLIDSDGYVINGCVEIISKFDRLAADIVYLCRSLGLAAYLTKSTKGIASTGFSADYNRIYISGDFSNIPTRRRLIAQRKQIKNVLRTGITVKPLGRGEYFGFAVDADNLFLLGDFTVTHNSSVVGQVAEENNLAFIDLRISQISPTDLRGIPAVDMHNEVFKYLPPDFLPKLNAPAGILFLDELTQAVPAVQAIAQQLVLDRRVGQYEFPANWFIWAAGNRTADRSASFSMIQSLANRFNHLDIEPNLEVWLQDYAIEKLSPEITAFVKFRPELLHKVLEDSNAWPSPRSWTMANRLFESNCSVAPSVGIAAAAEFELYLKEWSRLPNLEDISKGLGKTIDFPAETSVRYATAIGLLKMALTSKGPEIVNSLEWFIDKAESGSIEFAALFVSELRDMAESRPNWEGYKYYMQQVCKNKKIIGLMDRLHVTLYGNS